MQKTGEQSLLNPLHELFNTAWNIFVCDTSEHRLLFPFTHLCVCLLLDIVSWILTCTTNYKLDPVWTSVPPVHFLVLLAVLRLDTHMKLLGLVEPLTRMVPTLNTLNSWGGGWGSRCESATTYAWLETSTERARSRYESRALILTSGITCGEVVQYSKSKSH